MIRVLHIVSGMNRGGLETLIMNIYRNIDRTKIQFDFLVHIKEEADFDKEIYKLGGKIFRVPGRRSGIRTNQEALNHFFEEHDEYDIVHQHVSSLSYLTPLIMAKKHGVKTRVVHSHNSKLGGNKLGGILHYYNRFKIKNIATDYFSCSDLASEWLYGKQINNDDIQIINNGIEIEKFLYNEQIRGKKRKELGVENKLVIGHTGSFSHQKNHDFLVEIFNEIYIKNNNAVLILVGEGGLREKIQSKTTDLGLNDNVIFLGNRGDVNELMQAFDMFLFPSHYEGLPVTLVEAQTSGLKCVVSDKITKQIEVTDLISFKSLDDSAKSWATAITENSDYIREDKRRELTKAGFDIKDVALDLERFY